MQLTAVTIPGDAAHADRPSPAVSAIPANATRGIVVIHEMYGPMPEIERVVLRFAQAGYAAVAPNLFHAGRLACMRGVVRAMQHAEDTPPIRQGFRARDWLCAQANLEPRHVGLIGFCFGGMFALAAGRGFGAVSTNYGEVSTTEAMRGIGPVIACYAGRDRSLAGRDERLRQRLAPLGIVPEVHVYPQAGHSFLTDGKHPIARTLTWPIMHIDFHEPSANDAWPKILDFFARSL
jgi:carboxymethylenebutenolidase